MAVSNINDKQVIFAPITLNRQNRVENLQHQVSRIDREINVRENYVSTLSNHVSLLEKRIASNNKSISLRKEYMQTLTESRDLDRKRIGLLKESKVIGREKIDLMYTLLDRRQSRRSSSVDVKSNFKNTEIDKLDKKLTTLAKQDVVLKEQTKAVDTKADKLALKLDHTEKQMVKLEAKTVKDISAPIPTTTPNKRTGLATNYYPKVVKTKEEDLLNVERDVRELKIATTIREQISIQSQQNLYDSIKARLMSILV